MLINFLIFIIWIVLFLFFLSLYDGCLNSKAKILFCLFFLVFISLLFAAVLFYKFDSDIFTNFSFFAIIGQLLFCVGASAASTYLYSILVPIFILLLYNLFFEDKDIAPKPNLGYLWFFVFTFILILGIKEGWFNILF